MKKREKRVADKTNTLKNKSAIQVLKIPPKRTMNGIYYNEVSKIKRKSQA